MRSEKEMLALILNIARQEETVRVVVLNGSGVNPKAPKDPFQDYDIVFFVTEVAPFVENQEWIKGFGDLMILQLPDTMGYSAAHPSGRFAYLMQFADGNRIDLTLAPLSQLHRIHEDSLTVLLLDKDGVVGSLPAPSEKSYLPEAPTAKTFADCCNEFWWVSVYVAKALWRQHVFGAKNLMDEVLREELMKMLTWYFGLRTNFAVNPGKTGRNFSKHIEAHIMAKLNQTYAGIDIEDNWEALFAMCTLFRKVALHVADKFGLPYPAEDDKKVTAHLEHVRRLPRDAKEIY